MHSDLQSLLTRPGSILLPTPGVWRKGAGPIVLHGPEQVLTARTVDEVPGVVEKAEALTQAGRTVAGYVAYEAGVAFGLTAHQPVPELPVVWLGCYGPDHVAEVAPTDLAPPPEAEPLPHIQAQLNASRDRYRDAIAAIKRYIAAGDTYQVNYTCHARFALDVDPLTYFLLLADAHPVPYAAYLDAGRFQVLSLSPELLLSRRGDALRALPMKGTRKRGRTTMEDAALAEELVRSEKDRAENLMIVDMMRNDLGRICRTGSVAVPALFTAEKYRSVWQMTSTVTGRLQPGTGLRAILAATFPGSSVTGAPKRRTMEIIRELEPEPRGVYCGAFALLSPGGDFTLSLPIRTLVHRGGHYDLGIGAGIVWDSDPDSEYEETLLKSDFALRPITGLRLWETLLVAADGAIQYEAEHLARLAESATYWDFSLNPDEATARLHAFVDALPTRPRVVRMELAADGSLYFADRPAPEPPPQRVRVLLSPERTHSSDRLLAHKTNRRALYDRERARALQQGCFEVLFCNEQGSLTEGAITNLFVSLNGQWRTPPIAAGLLPGIWRAAFLAQTGAREEAIPVETLKRAEKVIIGNSVRGAVEVGEIVT
jgi:para-aminobenzoate synthetase/4-amino-4-deoxychorismate lyase